MKVVPAILDAIKDAEYEGSYIRKVRVSQLFVNNLLVVCCA